MPTDDREEIDRTSSVQSGSYKSLAQTLEVQHFFGITAKGPTTKTNFVEAVLNYKAKTIFKLIIEERYLAAEEVDGLGRAIIPGIIANQTQKNQNLLKKYLQVPKISNKVPFYVYTYKKCFPKMSAG